jgi:hypothetical protein
VIKVHQPESVNEIDDKDQCDQCIFKSQDSYKLKQHKRDVHRDCSASVTPPPKKRMEPEPREEEEVEIILKRMEDMNVMDENYQILIKEENKIPRRLSELLRVKGINIEEHGVLRVGGDGKCGARCVAIHTTGTESCAAEIRTNVNRHIIEEWEIYQDSYEYPHHARIGGGTKIFKKQEELLIFLMHIRKESFEEREGPLQKARWTHITPDYRIKDSSQSVKAEELTLTHEDEIHYNIMLPYNHSAFKNKRTNHTDEEPTLFGDPNKLPD